MSTQVRFTRPLAPRTWSIYYTYGHALIMPQCTVNAAAHSSASWEAGCGRLGMGRRLGAAFRYSGLASPDADAAAAAAGAAELGAGFGPPDLRYCGGASSGSLLERSDCSDGRSPLRPADSTWDSFSFRTVSFGAGFERWGMAGWSLLLSSASSLSFSLPSQGESDAWDMGMDIGFNLEHS